MLRILVIRLLKWLNIKTASPDGDIFIFCSPRSGMTWLSEVLSKLPRNRILKEPFRPSDEFVAAMRFFFQPSRRYVHRKAEINQILAYIKSLVSFENFGGLANGNGGIRVDMNIIFFSKVQALADEIVNTFKARPLLYLRNPISNSLSRQANGWHLADSYGESGWDTFILPYLEERSYLERYFDEGQIELIESIYKADDNFDKYLLTWVIDNVGNLRSYQNDARWQLLFYEDLVCDFKNEIYRICQLFGLGDKYLKQMLQSELVPSSSSDMSQHKTIEEIQIGNTSYLINRWKEQISDQKLVKIKGILVALDMDLYDFESGRPKLSAKKRSIS